MSTNREACLAVALALVGCGAASPAPDEPCARPPMTCPPWSRVDLPPSTTETPVGAGERVVVVMANGVAREANEDIAQLSSFAAPSARRPEGGVVASLAKALRERTDGRTKGAIVIAFDKNVSYQAAIEATSSASYAGIPIQYWATGTSTSGIAKLKVDPPLLANASHDAELQVVLTIDGLRLRAPRGGIGPRCDGLGEGVAVPILREPKRVVQNTPALSECVARLRADGIVAAAVTEVVVSVSDDTTAVVSELVAVFDALRDSFPRVRLGRSVAR